MDFEKKIMLSELPFFQLLDLLFSDFDYGQFCLFDGDKRSDEKILGIVEDKTARNLLFASLVLKEICQYRKNQYLKSLAKNKVNSKQLRLSLLSLEEKQDILTRLFWFSVIESFPQIVFIKSVRVVCGWQVVTVEDVPDVPDFLQNSLCHNFFSLFRSVVSYEYMVPNTEMVFDLASEEDEIIGDVPDVALRVYSLLTVIGGDTANLIDAVDLTLDVDGSTDKVFEEVNKFLEMVPDEYKIYTSFLQDMSVFTDKVFWFFVRERYPCYTNHDLAIRAGPKVVRFIGQHELEIVDTLSSEDAYTLAENTLDMAYLSWEFSQEPEGTEIHPSFVARIKKISVN